MNKYGFPIVPFPGEKFCPMILNKHGEICSEPTAGVKDGLRLCVNHLMGAQPHNMIVCGAVSKYPFPSDKAIKANSAA